MCGGKLIGSSYDATPSRWRLAGLRSVLVREKVWDFLEERNFNMSSNIMELSSEHSGSQNYVRDTPANQRLVDDSQTATSVGPRLCEVFFSLLFNFDKVSSLFCSYLADPVPISGDRGSFNKSFSCSSLFIPKKEEEKISGQRGQGPRNWRAIPLVPSTSAKGKDRGGPILLAAKDTTLPNTVPLDRMKGRRLIAFKKLNVVKKRGSLPGRSANVAATLHSSPITAEPISIREPQPLSRSPSPSPAEKRLSEKRPLEGLSSQGRQKKLRTSPGRS
ncbi:hypothetical protein LIER_43491 [Lithospermum erythrorhizon]|uniref:Uncharacterized protein n=1 Tax=Lithospermum erythrorhizon TaxID=34254 RepID=A0AAV3Q871_LITER